MNPSQFEVSNIERNRFAQVDDRALNFQSQNLEHWDRTKDDGIRSHIYEAWEET